MRGRERWRCGLGRLICHGRALRRLKPDYRDDCQYQQQPKKRQEADQAVVRDGGARDRCNRGT
jgi:hypothetical protein